MIWSRGELIADDALKISVLDRTFEHGLGLFETFRPGMVIRRSWAGIWRACNARLETWACRWAPARCPTPGRSIGSRRTLAAPPGRDVRIRITLTGGIPGVQHEAEGSTLWMRMGPLTTPVPDPGAGIARTMLVDPEDPLSRHKTLNYWPPHRSFACIGRGRRRSTMYHDGRSSLRGYTV